MVTYNVRKADGSIQFGATESQKDSIIAAGGTVLNVITKLRGREPDPDRFSLTFIEPTTKEEETKFFKTEEAVEQFIEELPKFSVTVDGKETLFRTEDEAQIFIDSLAPVTDELPSEPIDIGEMLQPVAPKEPIDINLLLQPAGTVPSIMPELPKTKTVTTEIWTVKLTDPKTGKVTSADFPSEEDAHRYLEAYHTATAEPPKTEKPIEEPIVTPKNIVVDPNLVTYLGITMTREQFDADFPEGTTPDTLGETTVTAAEAGKAYEEVMSIAPTIMRNRAETLTQMSLDSAANGNPLQGFLEWAGSAVYRVGAAVYDTGTLPIRPEMWKQQAEAIGYLLAPTEPETRAEYNQRISDFVHGDIDDPLTQREMEVYLQSVMPYTPQDQEYLDKAKEYRSAISAQIAADPVTFALELGASLYTGHLMGKAINSVRSKLSMRGFEQAQLDKLRPLNEIDDLLPDYQVPEMFRGTDLQPAPNVETWSADLYSTGGKWSNHPSWEVAKDVAAKGGQQVVMLKNVVTGKPAGIISYADYMALNKANPGALAGLGAFITIFDPGEAQGVLDQAVADGIFEKGLITTEVSVNQILRTSESVAVGDMITKFTRTELRDIEDETLLRIMPIMDIELVSKIIPKLDPKTVTETVTKLDIDTIIDILPILTPVNRIDVIQELDDKVIVDVVPKLDIDTIIDVIQKVDLDTDIIVDIITEVTVEQIQEIIQETELEQAQIQELVLRLYSQGVLEDVERKLPRKPDVQEKWFRARRKLPKGARIKRKTKFIVSFKYSGKSETKPVRAKTFPEAYRKADRTRRIKLEPIEIRIERSV